LAETMAWLRPDLVAVRLMDPQRDAYRERVVSGPGGRFVRFQRLYEGSDPRMVRVGLTDVHELARVWQDSASPRAGWERLRQLVPSADRHALTARGSVFDAASPAEQARFTRRLVETWKRPDATIEPVREVAPGVWAHERAVVEPGPAVRGPLWVGAGRKVTARDTAIGPAVMWDDGTACPEPREIRWLELEPLPAPTVRKGRRARGAAGPRRRGGERVKRALDVALALAALAVTLPLYPLIALAIVLEDGTPVFFRHTRETIGGKKFACLKFRSMRNDAEELKAALAAQNQADGPQFFIEHDPRMTRVGRLLRDLQFDELPQFINVLRGEMSVVGPRPSPFRENQYCPPWREARLSVRPGITGLWQISRTRAAGADFQEWIRYDIQYVENRSLRLDLWIIWQTVVMLVRKAVRS
ncbi:MAG TPA: sugar transferase, partial [Phycisphaerales bacterium]|nr:sugar transferase [Phycisphaerales bacterium]